MNDFQSEPDIPDADRSSDEYDYVCVHVRNDIGQRIGTGTSHSKRML